MVANRETRWALAAEAIAVKVRWFGVLIGLLLVETRSGQLLSQPALRWILALGAAYAVVDTYFSLRGEVFLQRLPMLVSLLEALFIGLLCHFDSGIDSPFRYYYMLSLVSCALRYDRRDTYLTCLFHCLSYAALALEHPLFVGAADWTFPLTIIVMLWVTWASASLSHLFKSAQSDLERLNKVLQENQSHLEERIEMRSRELQEAQANLLHQEKMAAFGLLAAGIAHEVGNPLASISSLVQMLNRREVDDYTREKLGLVEGQLTRIQGTLRELVDFSRPAIRVMRPTNLNETVEEALNIAKYYKRTKSKTIETEYAADLPPIPTVRDQLVQLFLNLVLNAIDATGKNGRIRLITRRVDDHIEATVADNGHGIGLQEQNKIFQPYYTTKETGTGLGLFVSHKIVHDLGGSIEFLSTPGEGTTFVVRLPIPGTADRPGRDSKESNENRGMRTHSASSLIPTQV